MSEERWVAVVIRVATPGQPTFQLRKGEEGLSVFDPSLVDPPLTDDEILEAFRPGSIVIHCAVTRVAALDLVVESIEGDVALPERLRVSHCEIRSGPLMSRNQFKLALKELE